MVEPAPVQGTADTPPSAGTLRRDLRSMIGDGVSFSVMVGVGETYLPAFAIALGHGEAAAGLLATLPLMAGSLLQLATPAGVRRLGSYRRWVVRCARMQALCFLPLAAGALLGRFPLPWIFGCAAAYWAFGMATSPAWNAWVDALVPPLRRARFFSVRARWSQLALFAGILGGGVVLEAGRTGGAERPSFAIAFALAAAARIVSARYLARQSEPPRLAGALRHLPVREVVSRFAHGPGGHLLVYLLAVQVAVNLASPFFTPYMLVQLSLDYWQFTILTSAALLSRVALLPTIGHLAHTRGTGVLLAVGAVGIVPLPALWLVSSDFVYLLAVQLVAGAAWASFELATMLAFFEHLHRDERTSILAVFNVANSAAMAIGTVLGSWLFIHFEPGGSAYAAIFFGSTACRLLTLPFLRKAPRAAPVALVPSLRTIAVRPSLGAVQRPVLPTVPDEDAPPPDAAPGGGAPAPRGVPGERGAQ